MDFKNEYTYKDITKPINRERMQMNGVSDLGTKSGGFGAFVPHFKVLSKQVVAQIRSEAICFCNDKNISKDEFILSFPSLKEIIEQGE